MTLKENLIEILNSQNQLNLYGYNEKFKLIADYFDKNKMPKSILFSGQKGIGKATFAYHIVNYLLSKNESNNYSLTNFFINEKNQSYRFINNNTHSNFFLIDNVTSEKDIKIEQVRELFKFINILISISRVYPDHYSDCVHLNYKRLTQIAGTKTNKPSYTF